MLFLKLRRQNVIECFRLHWPQQMPLRAAVHSEMTSAFVMMFFTVCCCLQPVTNLTRTGRDETDSAFGLPPSQCSALDYSMSLGSNLQSSAVARYFEIQLLEHCWWYCWCLRGSQWLLDSGFSSSFVPIKPHGAAARCHTRTRWTTFELSFFARGGNFPAEPPYFPGPCPYLCPLKGAEVLNKHEVLLICYKQLPLTWNKRSGKCFRNKRLPIDITKPLMVLDFVGSTET